MEHAPYVRLRPEDLLGTNAIWGWTDASPEVVRGLGLPERRPVALPLAGEPGASAGRTPRAHSLRRNAREGLASLLALEPSHPDRTLYLEIVQRWYPEFERWLERRVARAFSAGSHRAALRDAVALVNLVPARGEARYNLGLLLARVVDGDPSGPDARRWAALARGEFGRAAELSPELFWGHYHRGVLAYEAALTEAAGQDWRRCLDRYFADKRAPRSLCLPLLPLETAADGAQLPGLAYTVLLDLLELSLPQPASRDLAVSPPAPPRP